MDDEFTPELIDLRVAYRYMEADLMMDPDSKPHDPELMAESDAEFDRLIAKVRAEAWDEGYEAGEICASGALDKEHECKTNPYRKEGDDVRSQA